MFQTELHCHSKEVSDCATAPASLIVERYLAAGYHTIVLTNHLSRFTYKSKRQPEDHSGWSWEQKIDFFMNGYHVLQETAGDRLHILLGCELRSNITENDYLLYGIDEAFLRSIPDMMDVKLTTVREEVNKAGGLFFQAHPFRNHCLIAKPETLDGIEIYNGSIGHDSRNDIAELWAKKYDLLISSGSDFHHDKHIVSGGIGTEEPITTNEQLVSILKSGNFSLLRDKNVVYY